MRGAENVVASIVLIMISVTLVSIAAVYTSTLVSPPSQKPVIYSDISITLSEDPSCIYSISIGFSAKIPSQPGQTPIARVYAYLDYGVRYRFSVDASGSRVSGDVYRFSTSYCLSDIVSKVMASNPDLLIEPPEVPDLVKIDSIYIYLGGSVEKIY